MKKRIYLRLPPVNIVSVLFCITIMTQSSNTYAGFLSHTVLVTNGLVKTVNAQVSVTDNSASTVTFTDAPSTKPWVMSAEHTVVTMPVSDMIIPVKTNKSTIVLTHQDLGRFVLSDGVMKSVTRTPVVVTAVNSTGSYSFRPTLFVTLPGFNFHPYVTRWQHDAVIPNVQVAIDSVSSATSVRNSQYVHFEVNWDSDETIIGQLDDLAHVVNGFLQSRAYAWDVVIMGHSRGGIFAHQLAEKIRGHKNIHNMHTFLLDPTAALFLTDRYPSTNFSSARAFNSLFYDNWSFSYVDLITSSDTKIPGYTNYGLGEADYIRRYRPEKDSHADFANDWVADTNLGLERALNDIWKNKIAGSFASDGESRWEMVTIRRADIAFTGIGVNCEADNCTIDGALVLGPITSSINIMVGRDGVAIAGTFLLTAVETRIRDDQAYFAVDNGVVATAAKIDLSDSTTIRTNVLGKINTGVSIGGGEITADVSVGDTKISGDLSSDGIHFQVDNTSINIPLLPLVTLPKIHISNPFN